MSEKSDKIGELFESVLGNALALLKNAESEQPRLEAEFNAFSTYERAFLNALVQNHKSLEAINEFLSMTKGTMISAENDAKNLQVPIDGYACLNHTIDTFVALKGLPFQVTVSPR